MAELFGRTCKREIRKTDLSLPENGAEKRFRKCEKSGCPADRPECFSNATEGCCGNGYTSRWYHLSDGEHFCNECFDHYYRSHKEGFPIYEQWKRDWNNNSQTEANLKIFMAERILPYWVKCCDCSKWRQYPLTEGDLKKDMVETWTCRSYRKRKKKSEDEKIGSNLCNSSEDERVQYCQSDPFWCLGLGYVPLLKFSPSASLLSSYYLDGVGLSPTDSEWERNSVKEQLEKGHVKPFSYPEADDSVAFCFRPDVMEEEELQHFPTFRRLQNRYLALRNLVLTLWSLNCKEVLTFEKCMNHLIIRGLVRIAIIPQLQKILKFFTIKGYVNHGVLKNNPQSSLPIESQCTNSHVIVVGAGASGLATARQLSNFGMKVTVLEARDRIGGRVCDEKLGGVCVGRGAQIMNGCTNNPMAVMVEQCGLNMKSIGDKCELIEEDGKLVCAATDERVDFHFNALLDAVADWRKHSEVDCSLGDKLLEIHKMFIDQTETAFTEAADRLLQFHLGNLEYGCATVLDNVSALAWDQNESFPQFPGKHTILTHGYGIILKHLAEGLDIRLGIEVDAIDYSGKIISVTTKNGQTFTGDKVVITVPIALLKSESISFVPLLPAEKTEAINRLGAGLIEKVILSFPRCFWHKYSQKTDSFGHIPNSKENRGFCGIFYDLSTKKPVGKKKMTGNGHVLMTVLAGQAAIEAQSMDDKEIVTRCMDLLKSLFPTEKVPEPLDSIVTRWGQEPFSKMAYSFVAKEGTGEDYTILSNDVNKKLYFAGEATNRQFPQTVSGAYLSGTREAYKIQTDFENNPNQDVP